MEAGLCQESRGSAGAAPEGKAIACEQSHVGLGIGFRVVKSVRCEHVRVCPFETRDLVPSGSRVRAGGSRLSQGDT